MDPTFFNVLLQSDYEDVLKLCQENAIFFRICRMPFFWQQKALRDFGIPLSAFNALPWNNNKMKYEYLMRVNPGIGLIVAAGTGNFDLVNYFLKLGATNYGGGMAGAARIGNFDLVNYFLKLGATDYNTAMTYAAENGHRDIVELLLQRGATNYNIAIEYAEGNGHDDIANFIRDYRNKYN